MVIGTYILIITLNINGLNVPTKPAEWIQKQDLYICCLSAYTDREIYRLKVRGWKKIFYANGKKKAGVAIFISDKIALKIKTVQSL